MKDPIRIYRHALSGHSHRAQLFASLAGIKHELVDVDLMQGEHKKEPFLAINPLGQVPAIVDGNYKLGDSNAILVYLARSYAPDWIPKSTTEEAEMQRFLSIAANEIANGPAAARLVTVFGAKLDHDATKAKAHALFEKIEKHLDGREWLIGKRASLADVAVYSYTAHAPEGGVSLESYPRIRALLSRTEALPGFVPMQPTKAGLVS